MHGQTPQRPPVHDEIDHHRKAIDSTERRAEERIERGREPEQQARHSRRRWVSTAPATLGTNERQQSERARDAMLRRIEHRPVHAIDPQPVVPPRGHGIHVDAAQDGERASATKLMDDERKALGARRQDHERDGQRAAIRRRTAVAASA